MGGQDPPLRYSCQKATRDPGLRHPHTLLSLSLSRSLCLAHTHAQDFSDRFGPCVDTLAAHTAPFPISHSLSSTRTRARTLAHSHTLFSSSFKRLKTDRTSVREREREMGEGEGEGRAEGATPGCHLSPTFFHAGASFNAVDGKISNGALRRDSPLPSDATADT